jgi:hypothetical protein
MVDTTADYLAEIGRYPLLTKSQEIMLARQVAVWVADDNLTAKQKRMGRRAYEKLMNCNLRSLILSGGMRYRRMFIGGFGRGLLGISVVMTGLFGCRPTLGRCWRSLGLGLLSSF